MPRPWVCVDDSGTACLGPASSQSSSVHWQTPLAAATPDPTPQPVDSPWAVPRTQTVNARACATAFALDTCVIVRGLALADRALSY